MDTQDRLFKDEIYEQFSRIGKAISSPKRLELLDLLCQGSKTVEVLAQQTGMTIANTSQHLQVLRAARLLDVQKDGVFVIYRLSDKVVCDFFRSLRTLAENRLTEIKQVVMSFLEGKEEMESVNPSTLLERVRKGEAIVLDVRPVEEYQAGHIPGAISVPLEKLENYLSELSKDEEIVAYCRGPYCVLAFRAVEILRKHGFNALRMKEGVHDWRAMGYPVIEDMK